MIRCDTQAFAQGRGMLFSIVVDGMTNYTSALKLSYHDAPRIMSLRSTGLHGSACLDAQMHMLLFHFELTVSKTHAIGCEQAYDSDGTPMVINCPTSGGVQLTIRGEV
jgi:hypothetical protein